MTSSAAQQYDDRPAMARGGMGPDSEVPSEQPPEAEASGTLASLHAVLCARANKCAGWLLPACSPSWAEQCWVQGSGLREV